MRKAVFVVIGLGLLLQGCDTPNVPKSDAEQQSKQEAIRQEANAQVGMPGITKFTEMKIMRRIYELRDQKVLTYTYAMDMNGGLHHV